MRVCVHSVSKTFQEGISGATNELIIILLKINLLKSRLRKSFGRLYAVEYGVKSKAAVLMKLILLSTCGHALANLLEMEWSLAGKVEDNLVICEHNISTMSWKQFCH